MSKRKRSAADRQLRFSPRYKIFLALRKIRPRKYFCRTLAKDRFMSIDPKVSPILISYILNHIRYVTCVECKFRPLAKRYTPVLNRKREK